MNTGTVTTDLAADLADEVMRFVRLLKSAGSMPAAQGRSSLLILWPLLHEGPMRLRELAEHKGVDQSTISRQAASLVQSGLLRRDPDPADRRACLLALTERGRDFCRELVESRRQAIADALGGWSPDRVALFVELFRDFNAAVEAQQPSTGTFSTGTGSTMPITAAVPGGPAVSQENT
jgi:DNA-binding MarR family transcriptional regulator